MYYLKPNIMQPAACTVYEMMGTVIGAEFVSNPGCCIRGRLAAWSIWESL